MRFVFLASMFCLILSNVGSAGNVTARVSGGQLYIYGDQRDNTISIDSPQAGQIRVTGLVAKSGESTSINGKAVGTETLTGWTGGIFAYMLGGNDSVSLNNAVVRGATVFDLGDGNDDLMMGDVPFANVALIELLGPSLAPPAGMVDLQSSLLVVGGAGDDIVLVNGTHVKYVATFDLGSNADQLLVGNSLEGAATVEFFDACIVLPGTGKDRSVFTATNIRRDFVFDDSLDDLDLSIVNVMAMQSVFIYGTPSIDKITANNFFVAQTLGIFSEGGDDLITLNSTDSSLLQVFSGLGADTVKFNGTFSDTLRVFLDPGTDSLEMLSCDFGDVFCYGASENDAFTIRTTRASNVYIYGDSGSDSFAQSGNTFASLNLFSIENK